MVVHQRQPHGVLPKKQAEKSRIIELITQLIEDDAMSECEEGARRTSHDRYYMMAEVRQLCGGEGAITD